MWERGFQNVNQSPQFQSKRQKSATCNKTVVNPRKEGALLVPSAKGFLGEMRDWFSYGFNEIEGGCDVQQSRVGKEESMVAPSEKTKIEKTISNIPSNVSKIHYMVGK